MTAFRMRTLFPSVILVFTLTAAACSSGSGQAGRSPEAAEAANAAVSAGAAVGPARSDPATQWTELLVDAGFRPVAGFSTDFSRATVPAGDIVSGGPPKDGIPAVDRPVFVGPAEADGWLDDDEPVFVVSADGETRIYPVQILTYHEIVNDVVGETPVTVTYCPLCNSGLAFRRDFDGRILDFGTTGRLRLSNLVMYDRQTESWWQQATGEGLVGAYAGFRLELHPMLMLPWDRAAERYPQALVLSRETGHSRPYGNNPYSSYDTSEKPFLYFGPRTRGPFTAMDRVISVVRGGESAVFGYPDLAQAGVLQREVGGDPIVVLWQEGTASALDSRRIADGRDVGSANAFVARAGGRVLTFLVADGEIRDEQTGSTWDASGTATAGELRGSSMEPAVGVQHFWFSYIAFEGEDRWDDVGPPR